MVTAPSPPSVAHEMAVLFADVCGSTQLYDVLGDLAAHALINKCLAVIRLATEAHAGRVVKTIGDEIMAVFPGPEEAALAASEMQSLMAGLPASGTFRAAIRVGFNYGPVLERGPDGDVFGDVVNVAARLAGLAKSGQILVPETTAARFPVALWNSTRSLDTIEMKGKATDIRVVEILWQDNSDATMVVSRGKLAPTRSTLRLLYKGRLLILGDSLNKATMGRDAQSDIVVETLTASRSHARIVKRRERFILVDQSTNGSYITISGEPEVRIIREELALPTSGCISLGQSSQADRENVIEFFAGT